MVTGAVHVERNWDFPVPQDVKSVIAETKGEGDKGKFKDKKTMLWCEDAERVTGDKWIYVRVNEAEFYKYHFDSFEKMIQGFGDRRDCRRHD